LKHWGVGVGLILNPVLVIVPVVAMFIGNLGLFNAKELRHS